MTTITGLREIDAKLKHLASRAARTAARNAVNAGNAEMVKGIRSETPKGPLKKSAKHKPGQLQRSVGKRFKKSRRSGLYEGKAGFNVGKKRTHRNFAFHAPPAAVGGRVFRTSGRRRPLHAVQRAYTRHASFARSIMRTRLRLEILKAASG